MVVFLLNSDMKHLGYQNHFQIIKFSNFQIKYQSPPHMPQRLLLSGLHSWLGEGEQR